MAATRMYLTGAVSYDPDTRTVSLELVGDDGGTLPLPPGAPDSRGDLVQISSTRIACPPMPLTGRGAVIPPTAEYRTPDGQLWRCTWNGAAWSTPVPIPPSPRS